MSHEIATPTYQRVLEKQRRDTELASSPDHESGEVGQSVDRELGGRQLDTAVREAFSRLLNGRVRKGA